MLLVVVLRHTGKIKPGESFLRLLADAADALFEDVGEGGNHVAGRAHVLDAGVEDAAGFDDFPGERRKLLEEIGGQRPILPIGIDVLPVELLLFLGDVERVLRARLNGIQLVDQIRGQFRRNARRARQRTGVAHDQLMGKHSDGLGFAMPLEGLGTADDVGFALGFPKDVRLGLGRFQTDCRADFKKRLLELEHPGGHLRVFRQVLHRSPSIDEMCFNKQTVISHYETKKNVSSLFEKKSGYFYL